MEKIAGWKPALQDAFSRKPLQGLKPIAVWAFFAGAEAPAS
jgi:hypothetical protein